MGHHCCSKKKVKRGLWSPEEDAKLIKHITTHGHGCWSSVPKLAGLQRCGKSCRLRWINYLRPDLKRGTFTEQEERIIIDVHRILGNRWAQIAKHLPGRTDNEVKNFWNSCIKKKLMAQGLDPKTHNLLIPTATARRPSTNNNNNNNNNNVSTCFSQFNPRLQPSTTPTSFAINSLNNIRSFLDAANTNPMGIPQPPAVCTTLPPHHPSSFPLQEPEPMSAAFHYQDPNILMGFKDQSSHVLLDYTNCSSASSLEQANLSPPPFMDEACMWGAGNVVEPQSQQGHRQGQGQVHAQVDAINIGESGVEMEMSYNSSLFDLELMDSGLMPMEQLTWDC